jgi:translation initiation factor 1 (eIF-1/SUI1)
MMISFRPFLRLLVASALVTVALPACETSKKSIPEFTSPDNSDISIKRKQEPSSKIVATVGEKGLIKYLVPRDQLAHAFNRQFGDGTTIDKTMVRKVQGGPKDRPSYYLVGLGLRNGMFRGMAIPLTLASDSELLLRSNASRYIISGVGCTFCFFNFENNDIVGTSCEENSGGSSCDLRVVDSNTFFPR